MAHTRDTLRETRRASVRTSKAVIAFEAVLYIMILSSVHDVRPHLRRAYKITAVNFRGPQVSRGAAQGYCQNRSDAPEARDKKAGFASKQIHLFSTESS
jgi:hypothetical protein